MRLQPTTTNLAQKSSKPVSGTVVIPMTVQTHQVIITFTRKLNCCVGFKNVSDSVAQLVGLTDMQPKKIDDLISENII